MNVGLVVIVANGQVILNIIKIMTLNEEIYKTVMKIPYGKVATYGQIATICGNPYYARAVGNALHKNPNPQKIPCYRVVNSKGKLTENFAFGGLKVQSDLLISEGIEVIDGRVNLENINGVAKILDYNFKSLIIILFLSLHCDTL